MTVKDEGKEKSPTWDERYASPEYVFGTAPNAFLAAHGSLLVAGSRALCVGDGEGRNGVWVAEQGLVVTSFDFSPVAVEKARALADARGVTVERHVSSAEDWTWTPDAFDVVVAIFVQFAPPEQRARLFEGMLRTLRPGGLLLLEGYTPRQLELGTGGPPWASHLYDQPLLRAAFAAHELVELTEYEAELAEGTRHAGRSAVIDCVVRKH